jgi:putative transposase
VDYIAEHRDQYGVEPICRVLTEHGCPIAPSTFYEAQSRRPSRRRLRDEQITALIEAGRRASRFVAGLGARKMWLRLRSQGHDVARCTVERLMAQAGIRGLTRGQRPPRTTTADPAAARPADLVDRCFDAVRPDQLWVADFTYCPTWSGMVYVAFVFDVFSRRVLGWRAATSMTTALVLDCLEQAIWTRGAEGHRDLAGLIHHTDAGAQGEFNWSSQHLDHGGSRWDTLGSSCRSRRRVHAGSGRRTGRCARRCAHPAGLSPHVRCNGRSGS